MYDNACYSVLVYVFIMCLFSGKLLQSEKEQRNVKMHWYEQRL